MQVDTCVQAPFRNFINQKLGFNPTPALPKPHSRHSVFLWKRVGPIPGSGTNMESRQKEEGFSLIKLEIKKCCSDCKTSKTPLWRSGPSGPKSLCNACGIRHRKKRPANKKGKSGNVNPRRQWGEVERAALLLMALSCGAVFA